MGTYSSEKGKAFERWVAKLMGLFRNPLSGANNTNDDGTKRSGDVIHPTIEIEAKHYARIGVFRWWEKLKVDQAKSGKPHKVLIIRENGKPGKRIEALAVIELEEYIRLKRAVEEL